LTFNVAFKPTASGTVSGSLSFTSNASNGPNLNVPLSGTGTTTTTTAGQLSITPALVNFGDVNVGVTGTQPITMSASGASVTVSSDASSNSQFVLDGAFLPFTIPAGQSKSYNVSFTPTGSGTVSGSLSFTSNASNSKTQKSLTGIGTMQPYSVNLSWNASTGVAGYNVYRSTSSNGTYAKINARLDANTAYTDSSVVSGQTYYYEASAVNSSGQESVRSTPPVQASIP
jgi:fibronectin type 3 domain-containing protein